MGSASSTDKQPDAPDTDETATTPEDSDSSETSQTHYVGTATDSSPSHNGEDPPPQSDLEVLRALDTFLDDIDTELPTARQRARTRDHFELEDKLGGNRTTQEHLRFDYVRDDGIAVDGDSYIGLLKIHPQNWLSLSGADKRDTMSAYMSLTGHLERFYTAGASMASRGQTPILQYGRKFYIQWANTNIEEEDLKQRCDGSGEHMASYPVKVEILQASS